MTDSGSGCCGLWLAVVFLICVALILLAPLIFVGGWSILAADAVWRRIRDGKWPERPDG